MNMHSRIAAVALLAAVGAAGMMPAIKHSRRESKAITDFDLEQLERARLKREAKKAKRAKMRGEV